MLYNKNKGCTKFRVNNRNKHLLGLACYKNDAKDFNIKDCAQKSLLRYKIGQTILEQSLMKNSKASFLNARHRPNKYLISLFRLNL